MDVKQLGYILPPINDANRGFWAGTRARELRLQYGDSGVPRFPEYPVDSQTLNVGSEWRKVSGRATLWSWIRMHQNYFGAFADEIPYLVAMVQLEEGPMMVSTIVDPPDELELGMPLEVVFEQLDDERVIPKFRVVER
jgi:uncharacterized OB-fold protein